ncbi:MAG TPA: hypothetical protein VEL31_09330 [Ktedonobacteraceae bacterium]|nr:hypothetical protein [Ktedonobacteraceae bacterium]
MGKMCTSGMGTGEQHGGPYDPGGSTDWKVPCQSFTPVTGLRRREEALMKGQDQTQRPQRAGRWCIVFLHQDRQAYSTS